MMSREAMSKKVLFLCTGNSCRSQIAEAIINYTMASEWQAFSAGTRPSGYVHPKALQVLNEIGIDHQGESKHTDLLREIEFDLVVTVCDSAAEDCPLWLGKGRVIHNGFIDPAEVIGTDDEILAVFRQVRDEIAEAIPNVLKDAFGE
jgi:arsenate reductase